MHPVFLVGIGGFIGSSGRYLAGTLIQRCVQQGSLPLGTLVVNVLGCLLIGCMGRWGQESHWWGDNGHLVIVVGFLGGFTTFSAFGFETVALIRAKQMGAAFLYVTASLLLGLLAVLAGYFLAGHHR